MIATILDTVTGEKLTTNDKHDSFSWAENNWSCDCNRELYFLPDSMETEGKCSTKRFLVIAAKFNDEEKTEGYVYTLRELNEGYPSHLLDKHLPKD